MATRVRMAEAWRRMSCSSGVRWLTRTDIQASRLRRMSLSSVGRVARQRQDHLAAVGGVVGALDETALDERGDGAGHAGGAHLLDLGQLARRARRLLEAAEHRELVRRNDMRALEPHSAGDAHAGQTELAGEG